MDRVTLVPMTQLRNHALNSVPTTRNLFSVLFFSHSCSATIVSVLPLVSWQAQ